MPKLAQLPANDRAPHAAQDERAPRLQTRYYAFLSYSHKDKELADWLHRELEKYRVPRALAGRLTENGVIPKRLTPIFRDEHDLAAAGDLGGQIKSTLAASQYLIVLCSPTAAVSRWTNAEVEWFKHSRPEGCVLAAIASGEPFASEMPGREQEECFPPALRHKYDRRGRPTGKRAEPLAADLRDTGEGRRLGLLKLIAGMLGVTLDDLVQRDNVRRQRRLAFIAAASLAGMAVTSTLAVTAFEARNSAREERREAEGLVGFMLGDLKDKLEPIGRLDALDGVGSRVLAYYRKQDTSELSDASLLQRSRALSLMAEVADLRGNSSAALGFYREAMAGTAEAIRRDPDDAQRLYDHAQNVFYVGEIARQHGDLSTAEKANREYKSLAHRMVALDPNNMKWRMEEQDADANLGIVLYYQRRFAEAVGELEPARQMIEALSTADPHNGDYQQAHAQLLAWLADAKMSSGQLDGAIAVREQHVALLNSLLSQGSSNVYRGMLIPAEQALGLLYAARGKSDLALQHLRAAVTTADQLIPVEPTNTLWLSYAFGARTSLAQNLLTSGQKAEAEAQTNSACAIVQGLMARRAQVGWLHSGARDCWSMRARLALAGGAKDQAVSDAQHAVAEAQSVKSADPVGANFSLAKTYLLLGDAQQTVGNTAAASAAWQAALAAVPPGVSEKPPEMDVHATILQRLGRGAEMQPLANRLNSMGYRRLA
jgi:tetratricopeptide (TPR) repeat protein